MVVEYLKFAKSYENKWKFITKTIQEKISKLF
jgi:hypothetical protein